MIITYEKLTQIYKNLVREYCLHIGEGAILDCNSNILFKFKEVNEIKKWVISEANGEIIVIYPCNLRDNFRTLDVCVESYLVRKNNYDMIYENILTNDHSRKNILNLKLIDLKDLNIY